MIQVFGARKRFVFEEIIEALLHVGIVFDLVPFVVFILEVAGQFRLRPLVFGCGEAVFAGPLQFADPGVERPLPSVVPEGHVKLISALGFGQEIIVVAESRIQVRRVGLLGQFGQSRVQHDRKRRLNIIVVERFGRFHSFGRQLVVFVENGQRRRGRFRIGGDGCDRFRIVFYREIFPFGGALVARDILPHCFDPRLDAVHVDVAHDDDRLQIRTVPFSVIISQHFVRKIVDHFHQSDRHSARITIAVRVEFRQQAVVHPERRVAARAPLFVDHFALAVDRVVFEQDESRPVVQDQQAGVHQSRLYGRHVGNVVDRFVDRSVGVQIRAELDAVLFEVTGEFPVREVFGSRESHVFEEVRQSALILLFENRSDPLGDVKVGPFFRQVVVPDVIGQTVRQFSDAHRRIDRNGLVFRCAVAVHTRSGEHDGGSQN